MDREDNIIWPSSAPVREGLQDINKLLNDPPQSRERVICLHSQLTKTEEYSAWRRLLYKVIISFYLHNYFMVCTGQPIIWVSP